MAETLTFSRKFTTARDAVPYDARCNKTARGIYRHVWGTGFQDLVFNTIADARKWAESIGAEFTGPRLVKSNKPLNKVKRSLDTIGPRTVT